MARRWYERKRLAYVRRVVILQSLARRWSILRQNYNNIDKEEEELNNGKVEAKDGFWVTPAQLKKLKEFLPNFGAVQNERLHKILPQLMAKTSPGYKKLSTNIQHIHLVGGRHKIKICLGLRIEMKPHARRDAIRCMCMKE